MPGRRIPAPGVRVAGSWPALPGHGQSQQVPRYADGRLAVVAAQPDQPARSTLDRYALPGTMTRQGLEALVTGNAVEPWRQALDIAIARMRQGGG